MKSLVFILSVTLMNAACATEKNLETFYAEFLAPCGRSVLAISNDKHKKPIEIDPVGNNPVKLLRYYSLMQTQFEIVGYFTGKANKSAFSDCVFYPEFYIVSFKPIKIGRRVDVGNLDPEMHAYITNYPADRFVPEDYVDGPLPEYIEEYSYTRKRISSEQVEVLDFYGDKWFGSLKHD